jgi:hypothetical protein
MLKWTTWAASIGLAGCLLAGTTAAAQQPAGAARTLTALDYFEIEQLLHRYMFALDTCANNGYEYADLFTADGKIAASAYGPPVQFTLQGREALARISGGGVDTTRRYPEPPGCQSKLRVRGPENQIHLNLGLVLEPTPEGAKGKSYLLMIHDGTHNPPQYAGWYEDEFVKTPGGWRFKTRVHRTDYAPHFRPPPGAAAPPRAPTPPGGAAGPAPPSPPPRP